MSVEELNDRNINSRKGRLRELAAMLEEQGQGSIKDLNKITARFMLKTGVRKTTTLEYLSTIEDAGLLIKTSGHRRWKYDKEAEDEDLFV